METKSSRKQLDGWEELLKEKVGEGELLLEELGFRRQDLAEIAQLLADTVFLQLRQKHYTINQTIRQIKYQWPLTYALYLVLEGIYNYENGNYWDGPINKLGLQANQTSDCGQLFLDILAQHNLPTFEQSSGLTYVTPILLHGGIPNDFLGQFFDFLWQQERKHHQINLDSTSLLQIWRQKPDEHFRYLPKPAYRFLEHGGLVAADFVERCLELFDAHSPEEAEALVDLPQRVIRAFWQWREAKGISTRNSTPRIRLQRPVFQIAPYTTGITLYLPPQQFPHRVEPDQLTWHVVNLDQYIPCRRQRIEGGVQFEAERQVDVIPAEQYTLRLEADGTHLQTWILPGLGDIPVLVFAPYDAYQGDVLVDQERFRSGERWLLYPQTHSWIEIGESCKLNDLPRLTGAWQGHNLEIWQLAPGKMVLRDKNGHEYSFTITHEKVKQRPHLQGGNRLPLPTTGTDFPLYSGRPPSLILYASQPHRWQIAVRAAGGAQPGGHRQKRLSQLPCTLVANGLSLDLALPELLGETPVGKFEVVIRGPLGQSHHFGLRCIPTFEVDRLTQLYLINANDVAQFQFKCDGSTQIRQNPPQDGVELQLAKEAQELREYVIIAQPEIRQLNLQLRHDSGVVIPLTIPIYRLRWGVESDKVNAVINWQTEPSTIYPGALSNGTLWVDVPIVREHPLHIGWQLINAQGEIWREVSPGDQPVKHRLEWSLTEVTAVWRERQETLCWQLIIQFETQDELLHIPAFYFVPSPDFGEVTYEWQATDEQVQLMLLWERPQPGNYELQLWPLDRPWIKGPICLPVPETWENLMEWYLPRDKLLPETYLAKFAPHNPWQSSNPQRPEPDTPNSFLIKPPQLRQYYAEICYLRDQREASIEQLLALLAHHFYNDQRHELYETNQAVADQAENLTLEWLVRWADTIKLFDSKAYKVAQIKLFLPPMIARLTQEQSDREILERYFAHLPNINLNKIALWVLQSGLHIYRLDCLEILCRLPLQNRENEDAFQTSMAVLLDDIADGVLPVNKAVDLFLPNQQSAINWLLQNGGLDAKELLYELAFQTPVEPNWVAPGMFLNTPYGLIQIEKLRHRTMNKIRFCAPLRSDYYIDGKLLVSPTAVPIRLDLLNKQLHFINSEPYQCQQCQQLFTSLADYSQHHQVVHAQLEQIRKRLKQNCSVAWLRPRLIIGSENQGID